MANCSCRWRPGAYVRGFQMLDHIRDPNCPLHGNRDLFSPLANARIAARLYIKGQRKKGQA